LWWEGKLSYAERIFMEPSELDAYLTDFVARERSKRPMPDGSTSEESRVRRGLRRLRGAT
jgi:hypothetical protein